MKAYNKTDHTITGYSPIYLMNGKSTDILPSELKNINNNPKNLEQDRKIALLESKNHTNTTKPYLIEMEQNTIFKKVIWFT